MVALRKCYCLVHPLVLLTFISFISSNDGWKAKAIAENDRPILGVLAQASYPRLREHGDTLISADYVKYLQMAGARVVPIRMKECLSYYEDLFSKINGVLFPGGSVDIMTSEFAKTAKIFYDLAIKTLKFTSLSNLVICYRAIRAKDKFGCFFYPEGKTVADLVVDAAYDKGDYFPVWGTCLGFEQLSALTAGNNILAHCDSEDYILPLDMTSGYRKSRLLRDMPQDLLDILTTQKVTANFHHQCLTPKNYSLDGNLNKFYHVLSTNKDRNGKVFISSMEAYKYPIYGVQWHPEKNTYTWSTTVKVSHTSGAVRIAQYFADFLVDEARKSQHKFPSPAEEAEAMIDNYQPRFAKAPLFENMYFFNFSKPQAKSSDTNLYFVP